MHDFNTPWKLNLISQSGVRNEINVYEILDKTCKFICQVSGEDEAKFIVAAVNAY